MKNRFFVDHPLAAGSRIALSFEEIKHFKVTRIQPGETVEIINGKGILAKASFEGKDQVVINQIKTAPIQKYESVLFQAIAEGSHLDFIVEKGVELGITCFVLFAAEKSKIKNLSENRLVRLKKLTISALKQSKRLYLPEIRVVCHLNEYQGKLDHYYLADPSGPPLLKTPEANCGIIVGPESGLTKNEIDHLVKTLEAEKVNLSDNVLRCETAAMISAYLLGRK